jgi:hypothetical protein
LPHKRAVDEYKATLAPARKRLIKQAYMRVSEAMARRIAERNMNMIANEETMPLKELRKRYKELFESEEFKISKELRQERRLEEKKRQKLMQKLALYQMLMRKKELEMAAHRDEAPSVTIPNPTIIKDLFQP